MSYEIIGTQYSNFRFGFFLHASLAKKRGMWFVFRALPEKRTTSPLFCERSMQKATMEAF
jgi:hypothetical protein